ncbi:MAG: hypothetical protein J6M92_04890 [Oribacterium sp.]|nr:hypothetical protein [Oribacterium sp.]
MLSRSEIVMDVDIYQGIVDRIETNSQELLDINDKGYVEPDAECLKNVVIPDYKVGYESLIDTIRYFQLQNQNVVKLMNTVRTNYEKKVDALKSSELTANSAYGASSESESDE